MEPTEPPLDPPLVWYYSKNGQMEGGFTSIPPVVPTKIHSSLLNLNSHAQPNLTQLHGTSSRPC